MLTTNESVKKRAPFTPPEELQFRSGHFFSSARKTLNVDRTSVRAATQLDREAIVAFEKGDRELTRELWQAYVKAVFKQDVFEDIGLRKASVLLRGIVNEIRLYSRN